MKKVLSLAIAAALAVPMAVMADATVYGKAHVSLDFLSPDAEGSDDATSLISRASRVGVKGSEDLGDGLKAIYGLEWQVDMTDDSGTGNLKSRNQFVGLAGGFGTALAGRHDTPMKISTGKLDYFSDQAGDYNNTGAIQDVRGNNVIAYISPSMGGFTLAAALINADGEDLIEAYSIAGMYSNGPVYVALATENVDKEAVAGALGVAMDKYRLGLGLTFGDFAAGLTYEDRSDQGGVDGADSDSIVLNAKYNLGSGAVKALYAQVDDGNDDNSAWGIGYDHNMSKRTSLYAQYIDSETGISASQGGAGTALSFGIVHSF